MPFASKTMFEEIRVMVAKIPKGKVATYGAVAEAAGFPGNARRVAWALEELRRSIAVASRVGIRRKDFAAARGWRRAALAIAIRRREVSRRRVEMKAHEFTIPLASVAREKKRCGIVSIKQFYEKGLANRVVDERRVRADQPSLKNPAVLRRHRSRDLRREVMTTTRRRDHSRDARLGAAAARIVSIIW